MAKRTSSSRARELEAEIREIARAADKFTVLERNEMLGSQHYRGVFDGESEAASYAVAQIPRTRSFVTYELWTGSARYPGRFVRELGRGQA